MLSTPCGGEGVGLEGTVGFVEAVGVAGVAAGAAVVAVVVAAWAVAGHPEGRRRKVQPPCQVGRPVM